ncbi:hypothetical protein [Sorangium sp. So ce1099]|uniref:hypothetical protein n=1 Tax=Sorangium sp. So ce1099 TaxID=3133331 RepID=UPI003F61BB51
MDTIRCHGGAAHRMRCRGLWRAGRSAGERARRLRKLGNLVKIVEGTWSIQARDARGVLY